MLDVVFCLQYTVLGGGGEGERERERERTYSSVVMAETENGGEEKDRARKELGKE